MKRICRYCGEEKLITEFVRSNTSRSGYCWQCKECMLGHPGVYMLRSKIHPDRIYIGSSKRLNQRRWSHRHDHDISSRNYKLHYHIKKYGFRDFEFKIIKKCEIHQLIYWEQYYISELEPYFNIHKFASEPDSKSNEARQTALCDIKNPLFSSELDIYKLNIEMSEEIIPLNII